MMSLPILCVCKNLKWTVWASEILWNKVADHIVIAGYALVTKFSHTWKVYPPKWKLLIDNLDFRFGKAGWFTPHPLFPGNENLSMTTCTSGLGSTMCDAILNRSSGVPCFFQTLHICPPVTFMPVKVYRLLQWFCSGLLLYQFYFIWTINGTKPNYVGFRIY